MPSPWQAYLEQVEESHIEGLALGEDEPQNPRQWLEMDSLAKRTREPEVTPEALERKLGWTYLAWRRLDRVRRNQVRAERALATAVDRIAEGYHPLTGKISGISVGIL